MIENIVFKNFRGLHQLELSELKPVTLISGKNNVGKSSVLEGIFLMMDHVSPDVFFKINRFRGLTSVPMNSSTGLWESAFFNMNTDQEMEISLTYDGIRSELKYTKDTSFIPPNDVTISQDLMNQFIFSAQSSYTLRFQYTQQDYSEDGHFIINPTGNVLRNISSTPETQIKNMPSTRFINSRTEMDNNIALAESFGQAELHGKKPQIIKILQMIDPSIENLSAIALNGQVQLYAQINQRLMPVKLAGDGITQLLSIILTIVESSNSILLIDEIETGFHYSVYRKLWEAIAQTAKQSNCQIIATTHSYECIVGAIEGMKDAEQEDNFCYFRIDKKDEVNCAYRYSDELLNTAVDMNMEVR